jgi:hypothetical protein
MACAIAKRFGKYLLTFCTEDRTKLIALFTGEEDESETSDLSQDYESASDDEADV